MSYNGILLDEVMSWQVPNSQIKIILLILADHTDLHGICYPSIERMTKLSCMSRSSVIRSINWLVENEIIIRHSGGKGKPSLYQFSIIKETEMKKNSVTQIHKGNKVIDINEYIYPSGVRETLPFNDFWNLYPRKVGKGHARLAFKNACEKEDPIKILLAVKEFA